MRLLICDGGALELRTFRREVRVFTLSVCRLSFATSYLGGSRMAIPRTCSVGSRLKLLPAVLFLQHQALRFNCVRPCFRRKRCGAPLCLSLGVSRPLRSALFFPRRSALLLFAHRMDMTVSAVTSRLGASVVNFCRVQRLGVRGTALGLLPSFVV